MHQTGETSSQEPRQPPTATTHTRTMPNTLTIKLALCSNGIKKL